MTGLLAVMEKEALQAWEIKEILSVHRLILATAVGCRVRISQPPSHKIHTQLLPKDLNSVLWGAL